MNEELQKALADMINGFVAALGGATDFVLAEAPEIVRQLLLWRLASNSMQLFLALLVVAACVWMVRYVLRIKPLPTGETNWAWRVRGYTVAEKEVCEDGAFFAIGSFTTLGALFTVLAIAKVFILSKILLAPSVYLIEYAANLAK